MLRKSKMFLIQLSSVSSIVILCQTNFQVLLRVNWLQVICPPLPQTQQKLLISSNCCTKTPFVLSSSDGIIDSVTVVAGSLQLFSPRRRKFSMVR